MRRTLLLATALGVTAAVGGATLLAGRGAVAAPGDGPRIAVVDVFKLLNDAPRRRQIEQKRRDAAKLVEDFKDERARHLKELEGQLQALSRSDPKRRKLEEDLAREGAMAEFDLKWKASGVDQVYADDLEQLYAEVRATIASVASQAGYAMVLSKADQALNLGRPTEFPLSVAMRPVLYADTTLDITGLVAAKLAQAQPPAPAGTPGNVPPAPSGPPPAPSGPPPAPPAPPPSQPAMR